MDQTIIGSNRNTSPGSLWRIGAVGGHDGVKHEEQVLITDSGAVPLSTYRYEATFLD
ncbi:hypothetical protein N9J60_01915 [Alphaproteobacteria bacterium]|nr:hypothetical protein [Alphaproteobacteria bacterium]